MRADALRHIGIIIFTGIAIGIAGFALFPRIPVLSDSISYFTVAQNLLSGKGLVSSYVGPNEAFIMGLPSPDIHMPGWPLLIAGFMWLTHVGLYAPIILNIVLTIFSAVLFYLTVGAWSDRRRALVGSFFFLFFPLVLAYEFTGLAEISLVFWSALAVFLASIAKPKKTLIWLVVIGLAYTAGFCIRQTAIFLVPLISMILAERGFSRFNSILFGIGLAIVSAIAHFAYSSVDSLHEAQNLLFRYDLLLHTGLLRGSFYREILTRADLSPSVPLPELLWAILAKKPVRMLTSCISPDRIWQAETLIKALVIAIMVAGPFLVRLKRIRWGLLLFLLLIPMALWLYKFEARQFFAVSVVNMAFIFALAKSVPKKTLIVFLFLTMSISSVFYTLEVQKGAQQFIILRRNQQGLPRGYCQREPRLPRAGLPRWSFTGLTSRWSRCRLAWRTSRSLSGGSNLTRLSYHYTNKGLSFGAGERIRSLWAQIPFLST